MEQANLKVLSSQHFDVAHFYFMVAVITLLRLELLKNLQVGSLVQMT